MAKKSEAPGDWLSPPGPYRDTVRSLCSSDPRLRRRDPKSVIQRVAWPPANAKVTMFTVDSQYPSRVAQPIVYKTSESLNTHLSRSSPAGARRIYILEGLHPGFHAVLGDYFRIHPSFFVEHERTMVISHRSDKESDKQLLPSAMATRDHKILKYFELCVLPPDLQNTFWLYCASTGRHIGVTRCVGKYSDVGILRRKCSIWRRDTSAGGWDCVVITDPPPRLITRDRERTLRAHLEPFRGGYVDFMPEQEQVRLGMGPPRTSLSDDLCFYLQHHTSSWEPISSGSVLGVAQKIIAARYDQLADYLNACVSDNQWRMSRRPSLDSFQIGHVEMQWSDIQALERRLSEYQEDLKGIMIQCRISGEDPDPRKIVDWKDYGADFQHLNAEFRNLATRVGRLNDAITALASMAGNRLARKDQDVSLQEAKRTKALTFLGLFFIPLAYTASLFSMGAPYGPGDDHFWLYFAISMPLIVVVVVLYYLVDVFYTTATSWKQTA